MSDLFASREGAPSPTPKRQSPKTSALTPDHVCFICGAAAAYGFGVSLRRGIAGRWACKPHRDDVERMG